MSNPQTSEDIYERLAAALDALPHGFARTPSGVEIRLIKLAFTPEEVWLAGHLTRFPETADEIAKRVGRDVGDVTATLESLIPRRLVRLDSPGMSAPGLAPPVGGREEVPAGAVPGRLVRGQHAAPGQGVRRALRAVRDRGRGRADLRAAPRRARRRPGAGLPEARAHRARAPSTSTRTSSGTSDSSSSRASASGRWSSCTGTAARSR